MATSNRRIREIRQALRDFQREFDGDDRFDEVLDALEGASKALDDCTDEKGSPRDRDDDPKLGGRVKRREKDDQSDEDDGRKSDGPPWARRGNDDNDRRDG